MAPKKKSDHGRGEDRAAERERFVRAVLEGVETLTASCRRFGISRVTGDAWLQRFRQGGAAALAARSHRPHAPRGPEEVKTKWVEAAVQLRRKRPTWGVRKLLQALQRAHPQAQLPGRVTLWRRLRALGLIRERAPRRRAGPVVPTEPAPPVAHPNDLWTLDFKGHFHVATGAICRPLTMRDLHSRYILAVAHLAQPSDAAVRAVMARVFQRYGLPRAIRVDNGAPFAGMGPLGLSRLSVWWVRLGIKVRFTRRGKPQDNGAHEQMHRVLKAETAAPPAHTLASQQRRFDAWRGDYNRHRPHESLQGRTPAELYRPSRRPWQEPLALRYARGWTALQVSPGGRVRWQGRSI